MVQFGDLLVDTQKFDLHQPALCIGHTCKAQARESWSVVPGLIRTDVEDDPACTYLQEKFEKFCTIYNDKMDNGEFRHPECGATRVIKAIKG
jgi:hypothetical protein